MKRMELRAILWVACLLGVEKMGRIWAREVQEVEEVDEVKDVKEREGAKRLREEVGGFCEENIGDVSIGLARK
ncbi:MAG: hypothetical protein WBE13_10335 [Candidatus Acidiferrum sp.]